MKVAFVALLVLLAGCGAPATWSPQADGSYLVLLTSSNQFLPAHGTLPANATVVFSSQAIHDVQISGPLTGSSGGIGNMKSGDTWSFTFTLPGTYEVVCHLHEGVGMKATYTVVDNASA